MPQELAKAYDPHAIERRWREWWVKEELFRAEAKAASPLDGAEAKAASPLDGADENSPRPMFSLVIPPPNVTGVLHMGHMLEHTEIDAIVRWKRMQGFNALWLPGTDHAGIATQVMVERQLASEGKNRHEVGREAFLERVWIWKQEHGDTIRRQMQQLGASCDWSRERFTMDPGLSRAVREVFVRLYEKGLIYRGRYIINWCPRCLTALSDLEVVHEEQSGHLWHIRYPVMGADRYVVVATTRPETMLGDTAVAVHPDDERYKLLYGAKIRLPLMDREIPLITDTYANPEFGSGAVKVTPAHDPNDFEMGLRHKLAQIEVMDDHGRMNQNAGKYAGLDRSEARIQIVEDLKQQDLLEKVENYTVPLGRCQRCRTVLEPRVSTQWFVKIKPLAEPAMQVVRDGKIRFIPENFTNDYFRWMENIHDWCISRQLWWGHRIPAWYCKTCGETIVAREAPAQCKCGGEVDQDPDVLDTWFSSALWPFSTLGWPDPTPDLKTFYPTSLMITGFDILFFWVARMIMMGVEFMGDVPFRDVYIHALVRDAERQKMSKTKGNVVDPLAITDKYGTDAVRFMLAASAAPGTDIALSEERIEGYRAFANKIWNAARFSFQKGIGSGELRFAINEQPVIQSLEDRWIFSRLNAVTDEINNALATYRFHQAAGAIYHFFWDEFCDWYIELKKLDTSEQSWRNLLIVLERALRLLHPFMPFITEELWQRMMTRGDKEPAAEGVSISLQPFPKAEPQWNSPEAEQQMAALQEAIVNVRNIRAEMKIDPKRKVAAEIYAADPALRELARGFKPAFERLAIVAPLTLLERPPEKEGGMLRHTQQFDVRVPLAGAVDVAAERLRLEKERDRLLKQHDSLTKQLANPAFVERAPKQVVEGARQTLIENAAQQKKIDETLASLV